jgi:predicted O-methyltransferase YrrM
MLTAVETLAAFRQCHGLEGPGRQIATSAGRQELVRLFASMGFTRGAEIGVWTGLFSQQLCAGVPGLHMTCVDQWRAYGDYRDAKNNQARLDAAYLEACDRLRPYACAVWRMNSLAAAAQVDDRSLDFVYIDSNHAEAYVAADLKAWAPKVRSGGIVAGHDYTLGAGRPHLQVTPAVDAYVASMKIDPMFVLAADKSPSYFWVAP